MSHVESIKRERIEYLYSNALQGMFAAFFVATVLVFGFNEKTSFEKILWWSAFTFSLLVRGVDYYLWKIQKESESALLRFRIGTTSTALIWAFYGIYFYPSLGFYELAVAMVVLSGMAGGATTVMAGDRYTVHSYIFLLIVPFSLTILADQGSQYSLFGLLGLCFYLVMAAIGQKTINYISDSIELRLQNQSLIESMETEIQARTLENKKLLQRDTLTGLLNRSAFLEEFQRWSVNTNPQQNNLYYALFFIDLNEFKPINDTLGHKTGDQVLIEFSKKFDHILGHESLSCRWGGDEFVGIKRLVDPLEVHQYAQWMSSFLKDTVKVESLSLEVGAAIGISRYPQDANNIDDLISYADMAMYVNKIDKTRKYVLFDKSMADKLSSEFKLSAALKDSIVKNQLITYFQPIIKSEDEKVAGLEALIRWNYQGQFITPDKFIPLAEKNGFIVDLGYWVLKNAIEEVKKLGPEFSHLFLSVNVSITQLQDKHFVNNVVKILKETNFSAKNLHMELTESVFSSDRKHLTDKLTQLQALGVSVSIDDFGTGYSSLSLMHTLKVDKVKIDKSFVAKINEGGIDVIKAVVSMAKAFGYEIVAEGVETQLQCEMLKTLGIQYLQGYYFSKPHCMKEIKEKFFLETQTL